MTDLETLTSSLVSGAELTTAEVGAAVKALASADVGDAPKEAFLLALARKGETPAEVAGFALGFRRLAIDPGVGAWSARAVDIVGTGGDHAGGFNVSSLVTLVLACAGVPVMKHGNRGITSKCGSADLFAALGYRLDAPPELLRKGLEELGFIFFFAPAWHPAFKQVAGVRKALGARGQRTVFNILGPLLNPGLPAHVLLGAASPALVQTLSSALEVASVPAGLAVHGILGEARGIDELTSATPNRVRGAGRLRAVDEVWTPEQFGLVRAPFSDLLGGDVQENLAITGRLIQGRGPAGLADTIALNAAVVLWMTGKVGSVIEGLPVARDLLLGGAVASKIEQTRAFFSR